jgi:hypothetical protein
MPLLFSPAAGIKPPSGDAFGTHPAKMLEPRPTFDCAQAIFGE